MGNFKIERLLFTLVIILLLLSMFAPFLILYLIPDKTLASQIGDIFSGTTAPLLNISAILAVICTYVYQRRNDLRNSHKEHFLQNFQNLKDEVSKIEYKYTKTIKSVREEKIFPGGEAIKEIIRDFNEGSFSKDEIEELAPYSSILDVYNYLNLLLVDLNLDNVLTVHDKKMIATQLSLFYKVNLYINKQMRGDEICKNHKIKHEIPENLYKILIEIERKIV